MSFAARLQKAIDVLTLLLGFAGFNPPPDYTLAKFQELIDRVKAANNEAQVKIQAYRKAVAERAALFGQETSSLLNLTKIGGGVIAAYGRGSHQHIMIKDLVRRVRQTRIIITPADPTTATLEKKVVISDRGYGSLLGHYGNIVDAIKTFPDWDTHMPDMKIADLEKAITDAQQANATAMETYGARSAALQARKEIYLQLTDFVNRMKGYVKSKYGASRENDLIKSVRV